MFHDERKRSYLPVKRVLSAEGVETVQRLVDNPLTQVYLSRPGERVRLRRGGHVLLDFGRELHGGVAVLSTANAGRLRLRFGESVSEAMGNPDQDHAIHDSVQRLPRGGVLEYGQTGFRFLRVDALDDLELLNIIAVALELEPEAVGHFECSDEKLNAVWKASVETVRLNMQRYIFDGIKRDRMVWMGDLHPQMRVILVAYGAHPIIRRSLDFIRGHTPPEAFFNTISSYTLWWIIAQHDYYLATGDLDYLMRLRAPLRRELERFSRFIDADGAERLPERRFLDWPSDDHPLAVHAGLQGLAAWAFAHGVRLGGFLRDKELSALCHDSLTRLRRHVPEAGAGKSAAAMLTLGGVADRRDVLLTDPFGGVSTFFGYYMLRAMPVANALALIRRYWGAMLDYGATTFWEDFDLAWTENAGRIDELPVPGRADLHADFGDHCHKGHRASLCHGWAAGPAAYLSETVLGVRCLSPGFRRVALRPALAGMEFAQGRLPTPLGPIHVVCRRGRAPEIDLPPGIALQTSDSPSARRRMAATRR